MKLESNLDELIQNNLGLARAVVSRFHKKGQIEDSEFYSVACLALVNAARTYEPEKAKFSTWATRIITQKIITEIRKLKNNKKISVISSLDPKSRETCLVDKNIKNIPVKFLSVFLPDEKDSKEDSENKKLIDLYYLQEKSLSEIGKIMSLSKESIRKKINNAILFVKNKHKKMLSEF